MIKITKKVKNSVAIILSLCLILGNSLLVSANDFDDLGKVVDGSLLTNDMTSEVTINTLVRGNILNQGTTRISNNGNGSVNIYGAVFGSVVCDKMILDLTLQRYSGGTWYNVTSYEDVAYNVGSFSRSYNVSVTKGYYYRVKAACVAQKGSTTESQVPVSNGIWIG